MPPRCSRALRRALAPLVVLAASLAAAPAARADEADETERSPPPTTRTNGLDVSAGLFAGSYMHPPVVDGLSAPSRSGVTIAPPLADQTFRAAGANTMMGLDLQVALWTRAARAPVGVNVPLLGFRAALATSGDSVGQRYSVDGADVELTMHPGGMYEITLPGVGVDVVTESIYLRAAVQLTFQHFWMSGRLTQGALALDVTASSDTVGFDASLDLCARLGASFGCAYATPLLWRSGTEQDHLVNGVLFGLAWRGVSGV